MGSQENGPGPGFHVGAETKRALLDGSVEPSGSLEGQHCHPSGHWPECVPSSCSRRGAGVGFRLGPSWFSIELSETVSLTDAW